MLTVFPSLYISALWLTPQIWILDLNLKSSYQIASLFHMYIDMGEHKKQVEKQDRPGLIIETPPPHPGPLK